MKSVLEAALLSEKAEVIEELLSSCFVEGEGVLSSRLIVRERSIKLLRAPNRAKRNACNFIFCQNI